MQEAITAHDLTKNFGAAPAVDSIGFNVYHGEVFGFLGPNGAGKTTTIKLLLGLLLPSHGTANVLGFDAAKQGDAIRSKSAALFDDPGLYGWLSGPENAAMFGRLYGIPDAELRRRIEALMPVLLLNESDMRLPTRKLSRGTRQKWGLCRVFALEPAVLFLDEPTTGLDPAAAIKVRQHIRNYARQTKATIFLSTHNLEEATKICDRVGVIFKGKLVALGKPEELQAGPRLHMIRYGGPVLDIPSIVDKAAHHENNRLEIRALGDRDVADVIGQIVRSGREVFEVRPMENELEALFASLEQK